MKVLLQYTDDINQNTIELQERKSSDGVTFYRVNDKNPSGEVSLAYEEFNVAVKAYCEKLDRIIMRLIEELS